MLTSSVKQQQTSSLKKSAVPDDDFSTNSDVFLILPSYAEKNSSEIKQIIANEKLKLCRNHFYNEVFEKWILKLLTLIAKTSKNSL